MLDFDHFEALTFDCYGTLIDWEAGIVSTLGPILAQHGHELPREALLERYARLEADAEQGPFVNYKTILRRVLDGFGHELGFTPTDAERAAFAGAVRHWPPFADSPSALRALQSRYRLVILSNIDDDLFAHSARHLGIDFDAVITAEQLGSYKPSLNNFRRMLERVDRPADRILHVAQSLYHDIVPAKAMGLSTVWVNRRKGQEGFGATPPAEAEPDLEVPDLQTLASLAVANPSSH